MARWHALRFAAHRAAVEAVLGDVDAALSSFDALEEAPRGPRGSRCCARSITLLRAAADIALAEVDSAGSGQRARRPGSRRGGYVEAFHRPAGKVFSSDVRGALRFLERMLSQPVECRGA